MITSNNGNQYLTPDYLSPLSTTLDSKKSPLAMLAQTCSQIGADTSNMKSSLSTLEKSSTLKKGDHNRDKSSPSSSSSVSSCSPVYTKTSFKLYESQNKDPPEERSIRVKTPSKLQSHCATSSRCSSKESASSVGSSPASRKTPASQEVPATPKQESDLFRASPLQSSKLMDSSIAAKAAGATSYLGYPGCPLPLDVMASDLLSYPVKPGAMHPYLSYARMKTANGTETVVPVCRDPYCAGCQLSSHLLGSSGGKSSSTCPAGCTQCDGKQATHGGGPHAHTSAHSSALTAAYAHAHLAALAAAASQLPYVCSWIAGETTYCGKRFATSDELLQHLRTHTSDTLLGSAAAVAAANHSILSRSYPTPPLSPLATARYHPYSKPPLLPPSLASSYPLYPPSSLSPYFPPYSLYGPRINTSQSIHP